MKFGKILIIFFLIVALLLSGLPAFAEGEVNLLFEKLYDRYGITADGVAYDLLSETGRPEYTQLDVKDIPNVELPKTVYGHITYYTAESWAYELTEQTDKEATQDYGVVLEEDGTVWEYGRLVSSMEKSEIVKYRPEDFGPGPHPSGHPHEWYPYIVWNPSYSADFVSRRKIKGIENAKDISITDGNVLLILLSDGNVIRWQSGKQAIGGLQTDQRYAIDSCTQTLVYSINCCYRGRPIFWNGLSNFNASDYSPKDVVCALYSNGRKYPLEQDFFVKNNRMFVPIRSFVEACGGTADWNGEEQKATLNLYGTTVEMRVNDTVMYVNGELRAMDTAVQIVNDRIMIPVQFMAEAFGMEGEYNEFQAKLTRRVINLNR